MSEERRPHLTRRCPLHVQTSCDWVQVTSWFVGGPDRTEEVPRHVLLDEAARHMERHFGPARTWFT